jgi:hypothetical protein
MKKKTETKMNTARVWLTLMLAVLATTPITITPLLSDGEFAKYERVTSY